MKRTIWLGVAALSAALPGLAEAQRRSPSLWSDAGAAQDSVTVNQPVIRYAKWGTAAASIGALAYGVVANHDADQRYADLERTCADEPLRCIRNTQTGALADLALEAEYQEITSIDDRAKWSLAAGQIGILATVTLFLLDLPKHRSGEDIPYEPPRLRVGYGATGELRVAYKAR